MKKIEVSAAIIVKEGRIFVTRRGHGQFKGKWEFPGGKLQPGESREAALIREIKEELEADITIRKFLCTADYDYPDFHLTMHNFICELQNDHISLLEHLDAKFINIAELDSIDLLPADVLIIQPLKKYLSSKEAK